MSDSTVIDTLKDDICAALDAYEQRIAARYQEMDTHREAIAALKAELRAVNQRYVHSIAFSTFGGLSSYCHSGTPLCVRYVRTFI